MLGYGVWSIQAITDAGGIVKDTYDRPLQALNHARSANASFHQMRVALRDDKAFDLLTENFKQDLSIASDRALSTETQIQIAEIEVIFDQWQASVSGSNDSTLETAELVDALILKFDILTETMSSDSFSERQRAIDAVNKSREIAIATIGIALVAALIFAFILSRQITTPLRIASRVAERISTGDFNAVIPDGQNDETGALLRSMRVMQINIEEMIAREERQRLSAEARMADALETAEAAIMVLDHENNITYANSKVESYFPTLVEAIRSGDNFVDALNEVELVLHNHGEVSEGLIAGVVNNDEIELADGRWLRVARSEITDGGVVLIWTDISELKDRETALENARTEAETAVVAKSNFIANMSHEIRTPMNGVLGMAEVLRGTDLSPRQHELVSVILMSGANLMTVIDAVLDFAKLDADRLELMNNSFNLRQTVNEVASMMQATAQQKDIELIVKYAPNMPEGVHGDEVRIRQVLANLVGNAVKFTDAGHVCVEVSGQLTGELVEFQIEVSDTGIGIDESDRDRIFLKFEQADGSKSRHYDGTGLGLAICKELVEMMGGTIGVTDNGDIGSRFWVNLSLPFDSSIKELPDIDGKVFENVRILAIDDNRVNRHLLQELMESWEINADIVSSAAAAYEALETSYSAKTPYQLILTDYQMPGETGDAFTCRIKANPRFENIPVIMLSSIDTSTVTCDTQSGNYAAWLSKPIRPSSLMNAMTSVLSEQATKEMIAIAKEMQTTTKEDQPAQAALPELDESDIVKTGERISILIAEDNIVNQMVINSMIDEEIYDVTIADNGEIAIKLFEELRPALFISDLSMPVMDGFDAAKAIRAMEEEHGWHMTPIIAATAHVLEEDQKKVFNAGMNDFLAKPIRKEALEETIAKWLGNAATDLADAG